MRIKKKYTVLYEQVKNRRMRPAAFWSECGVRVISYLCAVIVMMILVCVLLPLKEAQLTTISYIGAAVLAVVWSIPAFRDTRYRLRDAELSTKCYFWLLLPVIGWLVFAGLMFVPSKRVEGVEVDDEY